MAVKTERVVAAAAAAAVQEKLTMFQSSHIILHYITAWLGHSTLTLPNDFACQYFGMQIPQEICCEQLYFPPTHFKIFNKNSLPTSPLHMVA